MIYFKIALAVVSCALAINIRHIWVRVISLAIGVAFSALTIVPHINSQVPHKTDLMLAGIYLAVFWGIYALITLGTHWCVLDYGYISEKRCKIGIIISLVVGLICMVAFVVLNYTYTSASKANKVYDKPYMEEKIESSLILAAANTNKELVGNLEGKIKGRYGIITGYTTGDVNGNITEVSKIDFWYYSGNEIVPNSVPKDKIRIIYISSTETPHMDTVIRNEVTPFTDYNEYPAQGYISRKYIDRIYRFYVPEGSIIEEYNFE